MKRIRILALIVCVCFVSAAWAQSQVVRPRMSRHDFHHRALNASPRSSDKVNNSGSTLQAAPACKTKLWDLGTFPGGTWAEAGGINDFGRMVAQGDTSDGDNHLFTIRFSDAWCLVPQVRVRSLDANLG